MTKKQEEHLARIKAQFLKEVDVKYRKGQKEHRGNLWLKKGVIRMAKEEAVDQYVYLSVLEEQALSGK